MKIALFILLSLFIFLPSFSYADACSRERDALRICRTQQHIGSSCPKSTKKLNRCEKRKKIPSTASSIPILKKEKPKPAVRIPQPKKEDSDPDSAVTDLPGVRSPAPAEKLPGAGTPEDNTDSARESGLKTPPASVEAAPAENKPVAETAPSNLTYSEVTSIDDALEKFHNSLCDGKKSAKDLEDSWRKFINGMKEPISKALATRAMAVDIATRTALFEANAPGTKSLLKKHPKQIDCEQDIIALSIRNRRAQCTEGKYKCRYENDIFGAASNSKMYNVWSKNHLKKHDVTGCFLNKELIKSGTPVFKAYGVAYKNLSQRVQKILGYHIQNAQERDTGDYLNDLFKIQTLDGYAVPNNKKSHYLKETMHYYHPQGLPKCDSSARNIDGPVTVTIAQELPPGQVSFPISDGTVKLKSFKPGTNEPLYILISGNGKQSQFDYKINPQDIDSMEKPNIGNHKDCLPKGLPPECNHLYYYPPNEGRGVPVWQKNDASNVKKRNLERPANDNAKGKYLKLSCSSAEYDFNGQFPTFGDTCSDWMKVLTEVDEETDLTEQNMPDRVQ